MILVWAPKRAHIIYQPTYHTVRATNIKDEPRERFVRVQAYRANSLGPIESSRNSFNLIKNSWRRAKDDLIFVDVGLREPMVAREWLDY